MKKRLALVLVLVLMASAATTALASPFADVPADHWAYDSVAQLAAAGLIEGYPDGTYGGARMMTRYEAAMVFARALNRLESQIAANNLLPELDRVKAELMAEIEAQLAAAGKPVVETRVVETVQKELDEEAVARLRAVEIATDALEGDMAYLEARMLGLIDGIRYDLNKLEETEAVVVEQPSMDEIEALIAQRIQESLVDVASGVKETTIVERVVSTTPELTRDDVELIAEALIKRQIEQVNQEIQVNRELIVGLVDWVDEIDADVAVLKDDVEGLKTSVATLEKSPVLSGELALKGEYKSGDEYAFSQTGNLALNVNASETTRVKAFFNWKLDPFASIKEEDFFKVENYGVEVTSETPVSRVLAGRIAAANLAPFSNYVLPNANLGFGGVAKVNIIDDLTLDVLGAQREVGDQRVLAALALTYEFMPELKIKLTGRADKPEGAMFDQYAAGIGLFGTVAGIEYTGDFAMDFTEAQEKDNFIGVLTAKATFEPVTLDLKGVYQAPEYAISNQMVVRDKDDADKRNIFGVEGGVAAELEFAGVDFDIAGRAYYEGGAKDKDTDTVLAVKADASATVDVVGLPLTLAAQYAGNKTGENDYVQHALASLSFAKKPDYGLRYGVNAAYEKNVLSSGTSAAANFRNVKHFTDREEFRAGANLGYGFDWSGAKVDVDYAANFKMPIAPKDPDTEKAADMTLGHKLTLGYGFTSNVKLTLGATVDMTLAETLQNAFGYSAGLTVKF